MSWQLGSLAVVTLAIGGGLIWYERSRPPSQIVALVAVLASLAVAGRIALAPIPNVVATTDIVIIAGYVLGPAPGFAVGALGGLISNFWLGQGAWTPWQMVGWGMCGIAGAVLWRVTRGHAGRFRLAFVCGLAGLAFGAWMNLQTTVSYGGDISLERYLALQVRAIPFDLAHMTGNIVFALVAGPAMIAALRRFRERFEWRAAAQPLGVVLIGVSLVTAAIAVVPPGAGAAAPAPATKAANWLRSVQNDDGGFGDGPGAASRLTYTTRTMIALAAAGINPLDVTTGGKSPYDYLVAHRGELDDPNRVALGILALKTVGKSPFGFRGHNLVKRLRASQKNNGSFRASDGTAAVNIAAWAVVAFRSAGVRSAADRSVKWLKSVQNDDRSGGGWGVGPDAPSDPDSTGAVLMAMPRSATEQIRKAVNYLADAQTGGGGFKSGSSVNSQSTALVVNGLLHSGKGNRVRRLAMEYLHKRQVSAGWVRYSKGSDQTRVWVTADALPGLAGRTLPVSAPPKEPEPQPAAAESGGGGGSGGTGSAGTGSGGGSGSSYGTSGGTDTSPGLSTGGSSAGSSPGRGSGGNHGGASAGGDATGTLPDGTGTPPVPTVTPVVPSEALLAASAPGPSPSPVIAILICLLVAGGLCGGTVWLARRLRW